MPATIKTNIHFFCCVETFLVVPVQWANIISQNTFLFAIETILDIQFSEQSFLTSHF